MHKNALQKNLFLNKNKCIECPSYFSNLSPIENLWSKNKQLKTIRNSKIHLWNSKKNKKVSLYKNCIYSIKKKLKEVKKNKENKIKY